MLSILIPAYNEEGNMGELIRGIRKTLNEINVKHEIIISDGGSTDNTAAVAKKYGAKVLLRSNSNFGSYLKEGIPQTKEDYVLTMDADLSHDPRFIIDLLKAKDGADIVIASRWINGGDTEQKSKSRIFLSRLLNVIFNTFFNLNVSDLNSNFRLYRKDVFNNIRLEGNDFNILPEIIIRARKKNYKIKEVPFTYKDRTVGKSKLKLIKFGISYFKTILKTSLNPN